MNEGEQPSAVPEWADLRRRETPAIILPTSSTVQGGEG